MEEPIDDLLSQGRDEEVKARINALLQQPAQTPMPPEAAAGVLEAIMATNTANNTPVVGMHRSGNWRLYAACAAIVIVALGAGYFWFGTSRFSHKENTPGKLAGKTVKDVLPGGNKAILTLADGRVIDLDKAANGELAKEDGSTVSKKEDSRLEFQGAHSPLTTHNSPAFNTVTTPNGGQYQVVLPDGSRVWLNAASSIRFPTSFAGDRKVTMTGEAYFEVVHNDRMPFIVTIPPLPGGPGGAEVTVLGTHFNINAYDNERAIHTTLLQGSVKVGSRQWAVGSGEKAEGSGQKAESRELSVVLKPGEQASLSQTSHLSHPIPVQTVQTEEVIAWKNGLFNLAGADLKDLMRQVERWYDVTVQYEGAVPNMEFQGKLNRAVPLSDIIDYLKNLGVECRLTGKTLYVKSK
jgi:transmembrane sensor